MGKVKAHTKASHRHEPLDTQLASDAAGVVKQSTRSKKQKSNKSDSKPSNTIDADLSQKILKMARDQQREEGLPHRVPTSDVSARHFHGLLDLQDSDAEEVDSVGSAEEMEASDFFEELEIDEDDQAALEAFLPSDTASQQPTPLLADLIMQKIADHEQRQEMPASSAHIASLDDKVVEVYSKVGQLLSRYRAGPLPKAFKILPTIAVWPSLLELTKPDEWTPHATLAATKILASNLDPKQAQKFYKLFLLPRVREEIQETKKLSVHLYQALKKALYKPSAFFKGILFPLCEGSTCTLREAAIIGSVISKVSIPVLHSGAALLKLSEMEYTGSNSLFIRILLDKKYALPYKVVDALVFHFIRFRSEKRNLPVLWHQSLLVFVQRYKSDITSEQRDALIDVLRSHFHALIGPEIRRELSHGTSRDEGGSIDTEMDVW